MLINEKQWGYIGRRYGLSPRELDVVRLSCSALTQEEIAKELGIKPGTVKTHLKHIYAILQIRKGNQRMAMLLMFLRDVEAYGFGKARKIRKKKVMKTKKKKK